MPRAPRPRSQNETATITALQFGASPLSVTRITEGGEEASSSRSAVGLSLPAACSGSIYAAESGSTSTALEACDPTIIAIANVERNVLGQLKAIERRLTSVESKQAILQTASDELKSFVQDLSMTTFTIKGSAYEVHACAHEYAFLHQVLLHYMVLQRICYILLFKTHTTIHFDCYLCTGTTERSNSKIILP